MLHLPTNKAEPTNTLQPPPARQLPHHPNSSPTITKQKHIIPANRHQQQWTISEVHSLQWIIKYSEYLLHGLQKRDSKGCWERDWLEKGLLRDEEGLEM